MIFSKTTTHSIIQYYVLFIIAGTFFTCDGACAYYGKEALSDCLAPAISIDDQLTMLEFDEKSDRGSGAKTDQRAIRGHISIVDELLTAVDLAYSLESAVVHAISAIRKDIRNGARYTLIEVVEEVKKQSEVRNVHVDSIESVVFLVEKYYSIKEQFIAGTEFEKEIQGYIEAIVREHNDDIPSTVPEIRMSRLADIVESRDKFPGDSFRRPWARVVIEFENGDLKTYIFKKEMYGAMEEWGYHALKTLGIDASGTRKYGQDLYLIEPIGKFNLGRVKADQYLNQEFAGRLSYLVGRAAARAFILGLADRKAANMRVILDESAMPHKIINADLASAFVLSKKGSMRSSIGETVFLLTHIVNEAKKSGVSSSEQLKMVEKFMDGYRMQLSELRDGYQFFKDKFNNYDTSKHEKLTREWEIAYQMDARKSLVLNRINPLHSNNYEINALLLVEILHALQNNNYFRDDGFLSLLFKKNNFMFEKTEDLFKMFRRQGIEFDKNNTQLLQAFFETYHLMARNLSKNENYDYAIMCYEKAAYIGKLLAEHLDSADGAYWERQMDVLNAEGQKCEVAVLNQYSRDDGLGEMEISSSRLLSGFVEQAI